MPSPRETGDLMAPRNLLPAAAAVAALGLPASAMADKTMPHPKDPTINVPGSIGGVGLGGTIKNAAKAWGASKEKDCAAAGCFFGNDFGKTGTAEISVNLGAEKARVTLVNIYASSERKGLDKPLFRPALGKFKTKEGIGLGTRISKLKDAYPEAKKTDKPFVDFEIKGKHNTMSFGFDRFDGHNLITHVILRKRH
jgi:hypothetical protein